LLILEYVLNMSLNEARIPANSMFDRAA